MAEQKPLYSNPVNGFPTEFGPNDKLPPSAIPGGMMHDILQFNDYNSYFIQRSTAVYETVGHYDFDGTAVGSAISQVRANIWNGGPSNSVSIRVVNENGGFKVLFEKTGITSQSELNNVTLVADEDLPAAPSILTIQIKKDGGGAKAKLSVMKIIH